jgi:hypothetical protein
VKSLKLLCTDKKENKIFLIFKEIQKGAVAKSYMANGLLILNICAFPYIFGGKFNFLFYQCEVSADQKKGCSLSGCIVIRKVIKEATVNSFFMFILYFFYIFL